MASSKKINVKERFTDGDIDLSMSDLEDVPVKEIAALKKTTSLDLSNNRLVKLPANFTTLIALTKLDLSKNELQELPEDFGKLSKLKHLDLYRNQLKHLPLSFSQLKDLKFLDLKDNPLVPAVAKIAGPCIDNKDCLQCAKNVVTFYKKLQDEVQTEVEMRQKARQKQMEINQQQKKQEEKKTKKKQKQKHDTANSLEKKPANVKKANKKEKRGIEKQTQEKTKTTWSWCTLIGLFCIFLSITLFALTSVDYSPTRWIATMCKDNFYKLLNKLPEEYQPYGYSFSSYVHQLHEKTSVITFKIVRYLNSSEIVEIALNRTKETYNNLIRLIVNK